MSQTAIYPEITAPRWGIEEQEVQIVSPRKPYVYGTGKNSALVHKINYIRLRWWTYGPRGEYLIRLQSPRMAAVTNCGQWISIDSTRGKLCSIPKPDAVFCACCHGQGRNFPRNKQHVISLELAKVRLGCIEVPL